MNTIAIVEEWDQFQDEGSIDWSGFPAHQPVEFAGIRVGLCEEFVPQYEYRTGETGRRFGFVSYGTDIDDDDPE